MCVPLSTSHGVTVHTVVYRFSHWCPSVHIHDLGCRSGRDSEAFLVHDHAVVAVDPSPVLFAYDELTWLPYTMPRPADISH